MFGAALVCDRAIEKASGFKTEAALSITSTIQDTSSLNDY